MKWEDVFINTFLWSDSRFFIFSPTGRHTCECQATKHKLISNCVRCGRIVCEQEGSGPCLFCGNLVCNTGIQQLYPSLKQSHNISCYNQTFFVNLQNFDCFLHDRYCFGKIYLYPVFLRQSGPKIMKLS